MKITVLMGSPFTDGNTDKMVQAFTKGAQEAGHEVVRFNVADMQIEPCTKTYFEKIAAGDVSADTQDMKKILNSILDSPIVVFATPLYYYGMTSQLKAVLDHFNSKREQLIKKPTSAILLANCGGSAPWSMNGIVIHFDCICRFLHWRDGGHVLAYGLAEHSIDSTGALEQAYQLGLNANAQARHE